MSTINLSVIRKNPLTIPVLIADKKGLFKKHNVDVKLEVSDDFPFGGPNPYLEGRSDAMVGDTTFFFYALKRGKKSVITSDLTRTISLVAKKGLKSLDGLRVGVNRAGLYRLLLENDLKDVITNSKITWINNTYERMEAFKNNEIDLLVAIEPFVTDVIEMGGEIIWSLRNSDKNLVMWAFDEDFYNNNKDQVKNFYKAIEEAQDLFNSLNSEEKILMASEYACYDEHAANRVKNLVFEKYKKYSKDDFDLCQNWMYREKEIDKLYDGNQLIVDVFN